jgi:hypothetical protein
MNSRLAACCFAFAATAAFGYWAPTSIQQLSANSDCVVIGRVTILAPNTNTERVLVSLEVLSVLKGQRHAGASLAFDAPSSMIQDVLVRAADGRMRSAGPSSFSMSGTCAVFLKCDPQNHAALMLVSDDDGNFSIDLAAKRLWRPYLGGSSKSANAISLDEFTGLVRVGDTMPPNTVQIFRANTTAGFWVPTPIEALAAESDCVVIGRIRQLVPGTNRNRVTVTMDELFVLKGSEHAGATVTFDAPLTMRYCHPFNSCTSNETCAVFLKISRENHFKLSLVRDNDGKFVMDWPAQHLRRANLTIQADDGENSLSLREFRKKVEGTKQAQLPATADLSKRLRP